MGWGGCDPPNTTSGQYGCQRPAFVWRAAGGRRDPAGPGGSRPKNNELHPPNLAPVSPRAPCFLFGGAAAFPPPRGLLLSLVAVWGGGSGFVFISGGGAHGLIRSPRIVGGTRAKLPGEGPSVRHRRRQHGVCVGGGSTIWVPPLSPNVQMGGGHITPDPPRTGNPPSPWKSITSGSPPASNASTSWRSVPISPLAPPLDNFGVR